MTSGEREYEQRRADVADDTGEVLPPWCELDGTTRLWWIDYGITIDLERAANEA